MSQLSTLIHYKHLGDRSPRLLNWYLKILFANGFIDASRKAYISAVVPEGFDHKIISNISNAEIVFYNEYKDARESYEEITLEKIPRLIKMTKSSHIAYFNTKGNSHTKLRRSSITWPYIAINNLGHFLPMIMSSKLNSYDAFGSFLTYSSFGQKLSNLIAHYPGNFWIANSNYLMTLGYNLLTNRDRYSNEYLLGSAMGNFYNIQSYPSGMYNFKSNYRERKLIKSIAQKLIHNSIHDLKNGSKDYYIGSELVTSQTGFPEFIMPPSWIKYLTSNEQRFML